MKSRETVERRAPDHHLGERQLRSRYWKTVRECLVTFHQFSKAKALRQSNGLRDRIEESVPQGMANMIYHDEPYYVACDIAGIHLPQEQGDLIERDWDEYDRMAYRILGCLPD